MRSLPATLQAVEESMPADVHAEDNEAEGYGVDEIYHRGLRRARSKVISLAKIVLPLDYWPSWENLGWEEQQDDGQIDSNWDNGDDDGLAGDETVGAVARKEIKDEEEEPEYIFPNRTPAAQRDSTRTRSARSRSFHIPASIHSPVKRPAKLRSFSSPTPFDKDLLDSPESLNGLSDSVGHLVRKATNGAADLNDGSDDDDDELQVLLPEPAKRMSSYGAAATAGPTIREALEKAKDGKELMEYDDLPILFRNNEHIITG